MTVRYARVPRLVFIVTAFALLTLLAAVVIVPRVAGQEPRTVAFAVTFNNTSQTQIPAAGHEAGDFPAQGDVLSGQGEVYAPDDTAGDRIGTFYFMAVGTTTLDNIETAANHLYAQGFIELWGQGSLSVTGTVNFLGQPTYLAVTGGTGQYAMATGQCTLVSGQDVDSWSCELQ